MNTPTTPRPTPDDMALALNRTQELITRLTHRVDELEKEVALLKKRSDVEIPSDVLIAISAAVSAYLGNKGKVKAVHFSRHATWAVQGRQSVQNHQL